MLCCWQLMALPLPPKFLSSNTALDLVKIHAESNVLLLLANVLEFRKLNLSGRTAEGVQGLQTVWLRVH